MPGNTTSGNKNGSSNKWKYQDKIDSLLPEEKSLTAYYKLREKYETQYLKKMGKVKSLLNDEELKNLDAVMNKKMNSWSALIQIAKQEAAENQKSFKEKAATSIAKFQQTALSDFTKGLAKNISAIGNFIGNGVDDFIGKYSTYFSNIETRLLGSGNDFNNALATISRGLNETQATSTLKVLENLNKLVSEGISYNVEQRAVLQTLTDKIAATFDATNGTLTRLIRLYQSDTTAAYLGMENILTQFLNAGYGDTSYLAKGISDAVSQSLLEATSQLGKEAGTEFEYVIQKWLGAFSSAGMSESTVTGLAAALGQLGSGDITNLSSSNFNNLLTIAASNAGLDYSNLLNGGLNASTTNRLFQGILQQLIEISNTDSTVARSQYASIFGMSLSDITSATNITSDRLKDLQDSIYGYQTFVNQTEYELSRVNARTSAKERVENVISNVMSIMGEGITSNAGLYTAYVINDMIDKMTGGIKIPMPFSSSINLNNVAKVGIIGYSALSQIGSILSALSANGRLSLNNFGASDYITSSGQGLSITADASKTLTSTTSSVSYVGSSSSSDILKGSLVDSNETTSSIASSAGIEESSTTDIYEAIAGDGSYGATNELLSYILSEVREMKNNLMDMENSYASLLTTIGFGG